MEKLARQLITLTRLMADEPWPSSEQERRAWSQKLGLPVAGTSVPAADPPIPETQGFRAESRGGTVHWTFHRDEFVGISLVIGSLDESEFHSLHQVAVELRAVFNRRWGAVAVVEDSQGFTALWEIAGHRVDLYWHAPRADLATQRNCAIQLAFDHPERSAALDAAATEAQLSSEGREAPSSASSPAATH